MNWLRNLLKESSTTFDQELDLLVARWTDMSRKGSDALTIDGIGNKLLDKAERLLDRPKPGKKHK